MCFKFVYVKDQDIVHCTTGQNNVTSSNPFWLPLSLNPLSPDLKIHILLTVLHTFLMELVRRICLNIKTPYPW